MKYNYNRKLKNYLINRKFQLKFLLRFFAFTFIVLTIGGSIQYIISNRNILNELAAINEIGEEEQRQIIHFRLKNPIEFDYKKNKVPLAAEKLLQEKLELYDSMINKEIKARRLQINHARNIIDTNSKNLVSAFMSSIVFVGVLINILLALVYGIFLTHRIAGNHYRLQKFAKQLLNRDLSEKLVVRKKDFFQETAQEFEKVREQYRGDIEKLNNMDHGVLKEYKL